MDKNIAAFLDKNAYTVQVSFTATQRGAGSKIYTYICNLPDVKVGDWLVVDAPDFNGEVKALHTGSIQDISYLAESEMILRGIPKLVLVTKVDKDVAIEPNADMAYGWVISKLDFTEYRETVKRNSQINTLVADAYKAAMRKSFSERILGDMSDANKNALLALLNK